MSRAALYTLLKNDSQLSQEGIEWFAPYSVDTPAPGLFGVIKLELMSDTGIPELLRGPQQVSVWVYDTPADYARIDRIVRRVKTVLTAAVHVPGVDGVTLSQCAWRGDSQDLYDDAYERITRNSSYEITAR